MKILAKPHVYYILSLLIFPIGAFADFRGGCCDGESYVSGGHMSGGGHQWANSMLGYGWVGFFVTWVLFTLFVLFLVLYFIRAEKNKKSDDIKRVVDTSKESTKKRLAGEYEGLKEILKKRLVRGDISQDEYEKIKAEIEK